MINWQSIKKILESQGKFDFKPFVVDGVNEEMWAYRNEHDWFEICDRDLKIISDYELRNHLGNYNFILNTDKEYRLLKSGSMVSELMKKYPEDSQFEIWIITPYEKIIKIGKEIRGYNGILGLIVLEPEQININDQMKGVDFWMPKNKEICYHIKDGEFKETNIYYCGTLSLDYSHDAYLFFQDDEYWFDDGGVITTINKFHKPIVRQLDFGFGVIDIKKVDSHYKLQVYSLYKGFKPEFDYIECKLNGESFLDLEKVTDNVNYYISNDLCLISFEWSSGWKSQLQLWVTFDWNGKIYYKKRSYVNDSKAIGFINSVVKLYSKSSDQYDYVDYRGNRLASVKNTIPINNYVLITRNVDMTLLKNGDNNADGDNVICLNGIMDTRTCEMVVPLGYKDLSLYCDFDNFYAIISEDYTGSDGNKQTQYGLIYNGEVVLPCNNNKISALTNNIFVFEEYGKYGIVSNGIKRSKCIYDSISLVSEISDYTSEEDEYGWTTTIPYRFKHALIHKGGKTGICSPKLKLFLEPKFDSVKFIDEQFFLADDSLYKVVNGEAVAFMNMADFKYIGGIDKHHLFVRYNRDIYDADSYLCLYLHKDRCDDDTDIIDLERTESFRHNDLDDGIQNGDILLDKYGPILCVGSIYYSTKKKLLSADLMEFACQHNDDDYDATYVDDTDYDRDTYYALGGDDYD